MRIVALVLFACLVGSALAQRATPMPLPFRLDGDGHACSGYLRVTRHELMWKSSFSLCHAHAWVSARDGERWTFTLQKQAGERNCTIHVLRIYHPELMPVVWEVDGYTSAADIARGPRGVVLACGLM